MDNHLNVPSGHTVNTSTVSFNSAITSSTSAASGSRVAYSYQPPPVAPHPFTAHPFDHEMAAFVDEVAKATGKTSKKLNLDKLAKVAYVLASVAQSESNTVNTSRSNKLKAVKKTIYANQNSPEGLYKVAAIAYKAAESLQGMKGKRWVQTLRLVSRAVGTPLYAPDNPERTASLKLMTLGMAELSRGLATNPEPLQLVPGLACLQDFLDTVMEQVRTNPQLLSEAEIATPLQQIAHFTQAIPVLNTHQAMAGAGLEVIDELGPLIATARNGIARQFAALVAHGVMTPPSYAEAIEQPEVTQQFVSSTALPPAYSQYERNSDIAPWEDNQRAPWE